MLRLFPLIALMAPLAFVALACASDGGGGASTGTSPTEAATTQQATPVDATRAVAPSDQQAYKAIIAGLRTVQETCNYVPDGALADCSERGIYELEPPPANDDDVSCVVGLSGGGVKPEYVLCSNLAGGPLTFFVIQP